MGQKKNCVIEFLNIRTITKKDAKLLCTRSIFKVSSRKLYPHEVTAVTVITVMMPVISCKFRDEEEKSIS